MMTDVPELSGVCYLCGLGLEGDMNRDHVPPKQIFPEEIRRRHNLDDLLTLPVHRDCNEGFQKDEEYFVHSIGPLAYRTYAGAHVMARIEDATKRPQGRALVEKVGNEFRWETGGIHLPPGLVLKTFDGQRVHRVVWKVVRGLFFHEKKGLLPEHTLRAFEVFNEKEQPPPAGPTMMRLLNSPGRTSHPAVFDYKFMDVEAPTGEPFHLWALLFWDAIMWLVTFHDPACSCPECAGIRRKYPLSRAPEAIS
jgi:hypothetical protein